MAAPQTAIVLAGGGALGAYEAGVLRYALSRLDHPGPLFQIYAGTSVGALNACFLAALAKSPVAAASELADYWESLALGDVLRFSRGELQNLFRLLSGRPPSKRLLELGGWGDRSNPGAFGAKLKLAAERPADAPHPPIAGLFDTAPLFDQMRARIPWSSLQQNLADDTIQGVALCATEVCTGKSIIFFQTSPQARYRPGRDPSKGARRVRVTVEHAMASAAIPFLFPSVQIAGICYTDGGLRQNTPLNPALRMGADRVLVVSVTEAPAQASKVARLGCRRNRFPGAPFLLGRTLHALLAQSLDYELKRVEMYNQLIAGGSELYGDEFVDNLNQIMGHHRNAVYRPITTCHIRPSQDLNRLARDSLRDAPGEMTLPGVTGKVMSRLLKSTTLIDSDLLSVLMFTPTFIRRLLDLGYHDAEAQRDELAAFFSE